MNEKTRITLLGELLRIADRARDEALRLREQGMSWNWGDTTVSLPEPLAYEFLALVGKLAGQRTWSERISETYVQERLAPILRAAREEGTNAASILFEMLVADVESYAIAWSVYVPIGGVVLPVDTLEIGAVALKKVDDKLIGDLGDLLQPSDAVTDDNLARNRDWVANHQAEFAEKLTGKVVAEYRVIAEPIQARERAVEETRRTLGLITYANAALHPFHRQADAVVGLDGELSDLGPWITVISGGSFHDSRNRAPTSWPIQLTAGVLEQFDDVGFWVLSDLSARPKNKLTDLDDAILRAVHWIAASQSHAELENRLLNLITCLEVLLTPKERTPIGASIAEGVALIVAHGFENRRNVKKLVGDLYRARSGVTHGGKTAVSVSEVLELRWIVTVLIGTLIRWREGLQSKAKLLEWLEKSRLSGEPESPSGTNSTVKELQELRLERGWTQEELASRSGVALQEVQYWERTGTVPEMISLRKFTNALGVMPEEIVLPPNASWINFNNHRFLIGVRREGPGLWVARATGWDFHDATEWPNQPVDSAYPEIDSPAIIITAHWTSYGYTRNKALQSLSDRIITAMKRALSVDRLPDDSPEWQPLEIPEHWRLHLEAQRQRRINHITGTT